MKPIYRIHIGAHKTATTHLQDTLEVLQPHLIKNGIGFLPRSQLRSSRAIALIRRNGLKKIFNMNRDERDFKRIMDNQFTNSTIRILSEENILGSISSSLNHQFYPDATRYIANLLRLLRTNQITIYLSVRCYSEFIPSAYSQYLRKSDGIPISKSIIQNLANNPPRWTDLVNRINHRFPELKIKIWTHENYTINHASIISLLTGIDFPDLPSIPYPENTKRLSANAISALEKIDRTLNKERLQSYIDSVIENDKNTTKFDPFNPTQKKLLQELYARDLLLLKKFIVPS